MGRCFPPLPGAYHRTGTQVTSTSLQIHPGGARDEQLAREEQLPPPHKSAPFGKMPYPERIQDEVRHILPGETSAGGGEPEASTERFFSVRWMLERERAREESDDCSSAFAIIPVGE